jgi:hypothetical protein
MLEKTREAFKAVLKEETDPAARQWLRLMLKGEPPARPRPPRSRPRKLHTRKR